jgi:hypothetical protein
VDCGGLPPLSAREARFAHSWLDRAIVEWQPDGVAYAVAAFLPEAEGQRGIFL